MGGFSAWLETKEVIKWLEQDTPKSRPLKTFAHVRTKGGADTTCTRLKVVTKLEEERNNLID